MNLRTLFSASNEAGLTVDGRRWRLEARSSWLRLIVLVVFVANLLAGEREGSLFFQTNTIVLYGIATAISLVLAVAKWGPPWIGAAFVVVDAVLVVMLLHEHMFGPAGSPDHNLTAPSLAVAFLLLNHVALRLQPRLVFLFATLVLAGWFALLGAWELKTGRISSIGADAVSTFFAEAVMALAFAFAAFIAYMLTKDHNTLLRNALRTERRRQNLSRFFSPKIVTELETKADSLVLERRDAAVMFVDLRSFTLFSEVVSPEALGEILAEYRERVTSVVFAHGGTVDKFIGDGVMALFGQPRPLPDDADRALRCALELRITLGQWREQRDSQRKSALSAVIGLHMGPVIGGVLRSGQHDEFTVFGDAVNVAERLERVAKGLGASLVVSSDLLARVKAVEIAPAWNWQDAVPLDGRTNTLRIAYLM